MNLLDFSTYKVNKLEKSQVKLELTVKKEVYEEYKNKAYTKLAPSVNLPGFRPGMAPKNVLEAHLGATLIEEAVNLLLPAVTIEVLEKENISPIDQVRYDVVSLDPLTEIKFTVTFTVYPEVTLPDMKDIKVTKESAVVTDEDIKKVIDKMVEDMKANEKDEEKKKLITFNDEFVKSLKMKSQNVEDFKKEIRSEVENQKKAYAEDKYKGDIVNAVVSKIKYDIPDMFIDMEITAREKDYTARIKDLGIDMTDFLKAQKTDIETLRTSWKTEATERVKTEIMLLQVSKVYGIKVEDADIDLEIKKIADPKLKAEYDSEAGRRYIFSVLLQQRALDKLVSLVK